MENLKQNDMNISEWLFQEHIENQNKEIYNPKPMKKLATDNNKLDGKQLNKERAEKTINSFYFTDRVLQVGFKIILESHHINHAISKLIMKPSFPEFGIEVRYIKKIIKKLSLTYGRLLNQNSFKNQTVLSA